VYSFNVCLSNRFVFLVLGYTYIFQYPNGNKCDIWHSTTPLPRGQPGVPPHITFVKLAGSSVFASRLDRVHPLTTPHRVCRAVRY
jgi:hypothetical protein